MAAKVETIRIGQVRPKRNNVLKAAGASIRRWGRRGQLGTSYYAEVGRHTGVRY